MTGGLRAALGESTTEVLRRESLQEGRVGVPVVAQWLTNPTRKHEVVGSIPGLAQWVKDLALRRCSCGVGRRRGSDPELLWL